MATYELISANRTALLTTLLPSTTYILIYTLPLIMCSLCLTFTGAFLTLDRSRSFPPKYDTLSATFTRTRRFNWILEGGIGGLAAGYVFGVHLSTFLAMMIPSLSSDTTLSPKSFLAVWIMSAVVTTIPSGRWKYVALLSSGISGGTTFSLAIVVIVHPSLLTRIILTAIVLPICTIMTILPLPRFRHGFLRFSLSSVGSFGIIISLSILSGVDGWANVWERFWINDGPSWGNGKEKGLSAAFCFFLVGGVSCDWFFKSRFGENPDQKWDSYLADFTHNLPDRAGTFQPMTNIWSRIFGIGNHSPIPDAITFPTSEDVKPKTEGPLKLQRRDSIFKSQVLSGFQPPPAYLQQNRSGRIRENATRRARDPLKFGAILSDSDSESDSDPEIALTFVKDTPSSSVGFTASFRRIDVTDVDNEMKQLKADLHETTEAPDYSDIEEDDIANLRKTDRGEPGWSPKFLRRYRESDESSGVVQQTAVEAPQGAVAVTSSLVEALDRIAAAQHTAFGPNPVRPGLPLSHSSETAMLSGLPELQALRLICGTKPFVPAKWDAFWSDVKEKARH